MGFEFDTDPKNRLPCGCNKRLVHRQSYCRPCYQRYLLQSVLSIPGKCWLLVPGMPFLVEVSRIPSMWGVIEPHPEDVTGHWEYEEMAEDQIEQERSEVEHYATLAQEVGVSDLFDVDGDMDDESTVETVEYNRTSD